MSYRPVARVVAVAGAALLALTACGTEESPAPRRPPRQLARLQPGEPPAAHPGHARPSAPTARLPAVLRRRRPDQRPGLRVRRRLRASPTTSASPRTRSSGWSCPSTPPTPPAQDLRLRHQPDLDHPEAAEGRRLLRRLLHREPGGRRAEGHADRGRDDDRRAPGRSSSARRSAPPAWTSSTTSCSRQPPRSTTTRTTPRGPEERPDRRHRRRPAHCLLHHRGRDRQRHDRRAFAAGRAASSSACCSRRATRLVPCVNNASLSSRSQGTLQRSPNSGSGAKRASRRSSDPAGHRRLRAWPGRRRPVTPYVDPVRAARCGSAAGATPARVGQHGRGLRRLALVIVSAPGWPAVRRPSSTARSSGPPPGLLAPSCSTSRSS